MNIVEIQSYKKLIQINSIILRSRPVMAGTQTQAGFVA